MTEQSAAATRRPDEDELNELVWAHNPTTKSRVKQMTRGKLRLLAHAYEETDPPEWARDAGGGTTAETPAADAGTAAPALAETPPADTVPAPAARTRTGTRPAGEPEQKEQS